MYVNIHLSLSRSRVAGFVSRTRTLLLVPVLPAQRTGLRKARRVSRPFLWAMAPPLALLLVARLTLGKLLVKTVDPTLELLFGDDIIDL